MKDITLQECNRFVENNEAIGDKTNAAVKRNGSGENVSQSYDRDSGNPSGTGDICV